MERCQVLHRLAEAIRGRGAFTRHVLQVPHRDTLQALVSSGTAVFRRRFEERIEDVCMGARDSRSPIPELYSTANLPLFCAKAIGCEAKRGFTDIREAMENRQRTIEINIRLKTVVYTVHGPVRLAATPDSKDLGTWQ